MDKQRDSFENFKSNVCQRVKAVGDLQFIVEILHFDLVTQYFQEKWYPEALYLLAMLDYLSRLNNVPICTKYDAFRNMKLEKIVYPSSLYAYALAEQNNDILKESYENAIPEFKRFNIVENEVGNVA